MKRSYMKALMTARRTQVAIAGMMLLATSSVGAQADSASNHWRLSASVGSWVPRSSVIMAADGRDTRLGAGPSFSLDVQYLVRQNASLYANGTAAFSSIALGSAVQPTVVGPSDQTTLMGLTGGVLLSASSWFGGHLQPTLRIGGGFKGYSFDLEGVDSQWRTTGDFGIGFRGVGAGPLEVTAEVRYLPSSFDQGKLPTRSIVPQAQRQTDLLFGIGFSIRP